MADTTGSIFHALVESMVEGGSLTRANVNELRRAGYTYMMIIKEAMNRGILDEDQYEEIADAAEEELRGAPGQITDAADILRLIRTNVLRSAADGIAILVSNNTLTEDIVNELRGDGLSYEEILEELAVIQKSERRRRSAPRGGRRTRKRRARKNITRKKIERA